MTQMERLAAHSEDSGALTRTYLTPEHRAASELLMQWMREAGMAVRIDAVGNAVGRYEGVAPDLPALMLGSHFDTVRNAGKYDGLLGIVTAIASVRALNDASVRLPFAVEVIGFADEEGVRFGATLLGSRGVAGTFDEALLAAADAAGVTMAQALEAYGLDPAATATAARSADEVLAFVEVHIEQGPVLESRELALGIVTAIAGASRFEVTLEGLAGHAGTVPMALRRDAATAAAEAVLLVERRSSETPGLVGTVGQLSVPDGAVNVIPGRATLSIDLRSGEDAARAAAVQDVLSGLEGIGKRRNVAIHVRKTHDAPAATCAPWLAQQIECAVARAGLEPLRLPSGAGHDAMALEGLTPIGMLFVRCGNGGISHHPDETMTAEDAGLAARVLLDFIAHFDASARALAT